MKTLQKNTQRLQLGGKHGVGSVMNYLMGNNATQPKAGEGATELMWSDRHAYTVTWVSEDGKQCKIRPCEAVRTDNRGYYTESQDYRYEEQLDAPETLLIYRNGAWRRVVEQIFFTEEARALPAEEREKYFEGKLELTKVIKGITYLKKSYPKISILFGKRIEYCDPTF